jgi:MoaA/NifB/PqqE/SkfB family radical SAM enzyme
LKASIKDRWLKIDIILGIYSKKHQVKLPEKVRLEASTLCQLNCVSCYMRKGNYSGVGAGFLKFTDFAKFVDMNSFVKEIELSNSGEIFLNPELLQIIEYAHKKGIKLTASNGVNFNHVSDEMLEGLVKYQFYALSFSIDGASQEVYSQYRRNGNFDKVIDNIKKLNSYKEKYNSTYPILAWLYIVLESSDIESEMQKACQTAKELNMKIIFRQDWGGYSPKNHLFIEQIAGRPLQNTIAHLGNFVSCVQLWREPQINWDGRFLACCVNHSNVFNINVFETGLKDVLNSKLIWETKRMLVGGKECKTSPCYNCLHYKRMRATKNFVI